MLGQKYEGRYVAQVRWLADEDGGASPDDEITIEIDYEGADGKSACGMFSVDVLVDVLIRDTGVHERGVGALRFARGANGAELWFSSERVNMSAILSRTGGQGWLMGSFHAYSDGGRRNANFSSQSVITVFSDAGAGGAP